MNLLELLESAGTPGQTIAIASIVAIGLSAAMAVLLGFRRIAPTFVVSPLALLTLAANGYAAFAVWGLREALFDAPAVQRTTELELAIRQSAGVMAAGGATATIGGLAVLAILAIDDLTSRDGSPVWTVWHAAPAVLGGGLAAGVATAANTPELAGALLLAGLLAGVASTRKSTEAAHPRADAWRATAVLCTGLIGIGVSSWLFCDALWTVYQERTGILTTLTDDELQSALDALSWRLVVAPVALSIAGAAVAWALSRPTVRGVKGFVLGALLVTGTGFSAHRTVDEMTETLTALQTDFDVEGRHRVERRLHIELPRVVDADLEPPGLELTISAHGVQIGGFPVITIRTSPTGRSFPVSQMRGGAIPDITDTLTGMVRDAATATVQTDGRARITVWADASEQWSVVRVVLASIVLAESYDADIAVVVPGERITTVPLPIVPGPPTDVLHANGGLENVRSDDDAVFDVDDDVALGTVIATLEEYPEARFMLR